VIQQPIPLQQAEKAVNTVFNLPVITTAAGYSPGSVGKLRKRPKR